ncbi:MAG: bifunctional 4-hydroxy-2-oxoglutarate aldolase/2-dehydro-3-deoxy-phosphogluconate aldolase [Alkalinema sp. CAN_BIN05]|nr:bifunctional 4-hydroxy-2-oxoglutarate aldolase/2-dehydro-3-deoxy-phosphogluconate aldolase [Alkalinema sp. CAN_BIN05]
MSWTSLLMQHRSIAVIRAPEFEVGLEMARSVARAGIKLIEITWNSDRPAHLIATLRQELTDCTIGAGTLITPAQLTEAISADAQFLFSPHCDPDLISRAKRVEIPIVPGALTPTEIITAWQAGANSVKVFPVHSLGGASYIRSLKSPMQGIPLIPTGGVSIENSADFIKAGAIAVGLSSELFLPSLIQGRNWDGLHDRAKSLIDQLQPYCH